MGGSAGDDPNRTIRSIFPERESATECAENQDWPFILREDRVPIPGRVRPADPRRTAGADTWHKARGNEKGPPSCRMAAL